LIRAGSGLSTGRSDGILLGSEEQHAGPGGTCSVIPDRRYEDLQVTDPVGLTIEGIRSMVDAIKDRMPVSA
jgi:hypothetical protein